MAMRWLQQCGHRVIALVGGGTAMVGDPSGKTEARPVLSLAEIDANAESLKGQLSRFLDFSSPERAILLNNATWLRELNYIEFLRDIGRHFSVNRMLAAESVKIRLEAGLSFLEFNYMLLQAYDFYVLRRDHQCDLQLGGQDQWGNIVAGVDLTRRLLGQEVFGATLPLLLKSDGEKFGKTASGAVWLDLARTPAYDYYQFWRNVEDAEVSRLLAFFTALPMAEVRRLGALPAPAINRAKEILAFEATLLAHGFEAARQSYLAAGGEFGFADREGRLETSSRICEVQAGAAAESIPTQALPAADLAAGMPVLKLLLAVGLAQSNGEGRRLIQGGGCYLNDTRVSDDQRLVTMADLTGGELFVRAGKKNRRRVVAEG